MHWESMCKHGTETVVAMPEWLEPEKQNRVLGLDSCIVDQITALWDLHIETLGCCCGHSKEEPSVIVPSSANADCIKRAIDVLKSDEGRAWRVLQWRLVEAGTTGAV